MNTSRMSLEMMPRPNEVRVARQRVAHQCEDMGDERTEAAALMVSELVTSAIRHRPDRVTLTITRVPRSLHVDVRVEAARTAGLEAAADPYSIELRPGLMILEGLAEEWGTKSSAGGAVKSVWFVIDGP